MTVLLNLVLPKSSRAEEQEALAESQAQVGTRNERASDEALASDEQQIQQAKKYDD